MGEKLKIPDSSFVPAGDGLPEFEISSIVVGNQAMPLYENGLAKSEIYGQCDSEIAGQCHNGMQGIAPAGNDGANLLPTLEVTSLLTGEPPATNEMPKSEIYGQCDSEIVGNCY